MEWEGQCSEANERPARPGQVAGRLAVAAPWLKRAFCLWDGHAAGARRGTPFTGLVGLSLASLHVRTHWSSRELQQWC